MQTCANCSVEAFYVYSLTSEFKQYYCSLHLPRFLKDQRHGGAVSRYIAPVVVKPKKSAPVVEESAVEEAPSEE
jgi:hypothetical protein